MNKKIEMSLETARQMYKEGNETTNKWLLENFTKEELEPKKGFTWEDIEMGRYAFVSTYRPLSIKHEKSIGAFSRLSHIVNKYNEGKMADNCDGFVYVVVYDGKGLECCCSIEKRNHLSFLNAKDAEISMEVNRQSWLDYWMID